MNMTSNNEDNLLKSFGPYRILTTSEAVEGKTIFNPKIYGSIKLYGKGTEKIEKDEQKE